MRQAAVWAAAGAGDESRTAKATIAAPQTLGAGVLGSFKTSRP